MADWKQFLHTLGTEGALGATSYGAKRIGHHISTLPFKTYPQTTLIRPQPLQWGLGRLASGLPRVLHWPAHGLGRLLPFPVLGPVIDLFTPSDSIMSGSDEMRLLRKAKQRLAAEAAQEEQEAQQIPITSITHPDGVIHYPQEHRWDFSAVPEIITRSRSSSPSGGHTTLFEKLRKHLDESDGGANGQILSPDSGTTVPKWWEKLLHQPDSNPQPLPAPLPNFPGPIDPGSFTPPPLPKIEEIGKDMEPVFEPQIPDWFPELPRPDFPTPIAPPPVVPGLPELPRPDFPSPRGPGFTPSPVVPDWFPELPAPNFRSPIDPGFGPPQGPGSFTPPPLPPIGGIAGGLGLPGAGGLTR